MKKLVLLVSIVTFCSAIIPANAQGACDRKTSKGQSIDIADKRDYKRMKKFRYNKYLNKQSIGVLIQQMRMAFVKHRFITVRVKNLRGVQFFVNENLSIEVFINKFQNVESFNENLDWNLENVKQEVVSAINIYYKGVCMKHNE